MSVVYVHIGMPKTGSSAIQDCLFANRKLLEEKGICYPSFDVKYTGIGPKRNAHWLDFIKRDVQPHRENTEKCFAALYAYAEQYPKIILTDEGIWNQVAYKRHVWRELKSRLDEKNIELKVIVYLRRQDLYIYSMWSQIIKADRTKEELPQYSFREYYETGEYGEINVTYDNTLRIIESVLGRDNMCVRIFERDQFCGKDKTIFSDFFDAIDEEFFPDLVIPDDLVNISYKGSVLETKRLLNRHAEFAPYMPQLRQYLEAVQIDMAQEGSLAERQDFPKAEREAFLSRYAEGNAYVARHYFGREDGILFRPPGEDKLSDTSAYTTEEIADVCARTMLKMLAYEEELSSQHREVLASYEQLKKDKAKAVYLLSRIRHRLQDR